METKEERIKSILEYEKLPRFTRWEDVPKNFTTERKIRKMGLESKTIVAYFENDEYNELPLYDINKEKKRPPKIPNMSCIKCGSTNTIKRGKYWLKKETLQSYFCKDCKKWFKGEVLFLRKHSSEET